MISLQTCVSINKNLLSIYCVLSILLDITAKDTEVKEISLTNPKHLRRDTWQGTNCRCWIVWEQILTATGGQREEKIDDGGTFWEVFLKELELELDSQRWGEFNKVKGKRRLFQGGRSMWAKTRKQAWLVYALSVTRRLPHNRVPLCWFKVKACWGGRQDMWVVGTLAESWWGSELFLLLVSIVTLHCLYSVGGGRWLWWLWSSRLQYISFSEPAGSPNQLPPQVPW